MIYVKGIRNSFQNFPLTDPSIPQTNPARQEYTAKLNRERAALA
jgi:hypothetical protein